MSTYNSRQFQDNGNSTFKELGLIHYITDSSESGFNNSCSHLAVWQVHHYPLVYTELCPSTYWTQVYLSTRQCLKINITGQKKNWHISTLSCLLYQTDLLFHLLPIPKFDCNKFNWRLPEVDAFLTQHISEINVFSHIYHLQIHLGVRF